MVLALGEEVGPSNQLLHVSVLPHVVAGDVGIVAGRRHPRGPSLHSLPMQLGVDFHVGNVARGLPVF